MPPATKRIINFIILRPDGEPWAGVRLPFTLTPGTYTPETQYPTTTIVAAATDDDGVGSVELWPNELGATSSEYVVNFPTGETAAFIVPDGEEEDELELSELRDLYAGPSDPNYQTILDVIQPQIDAALELVFTVAGEPVASAVVVRVLVKSAFTLPANMAGSGASPTINPTAPSVWSVQRDSIEVGTITFATNGTAAFATTGGTAKAFTDGQILTIIAAAVPDATLADVAVTIARVVTP